MHRHEVVGCGVLLLLLFLHAGGPLGAQAILNPNQIKGTIRLTNSAPAVLAILTAEAERFTSAQIQATSVGGTPPLVATSQLTLAPPGLSAPYQITVEAGAAGGIAYTVAPRLSRVSTYHFAPAVSAPVRPEPAPDVVLDFAECAGLLDIRWQTAAGTPVAVDAGQIRAHRETSPGAGQFALQAVAPAIFPATRQRYLAVRGDGSRYQVEVDFSIGTDPFADQRRTLHLATVQVACDAIVEIVVPVPEPGALGRIIGEVDLVGERENRLARHSYTLVTADSGPFNNFRYDTLAADPSAGPFKLENLLPRATGGYRVYAAMSLRRGRRAEWFRTPAERVPVGAGTTNLGTTFRMTPGIVAGDLLLAGPPGGPAGSCLLDVDRDADRDADGDGVPDDFALESTAAIASGLERKAPGATRSTDWGFARAGVEGSFDAGIQSFVGDYELVLGNLLDEPGLWAARAFKLRLRDTATPDIPATYQDSTSTITDNAIPDLLVVPGETQRIPRRYCFSQVNFTLRATTGTFLNPRAAGTGSFRAADFEGRAADYAVSFTAAGTPRTTPAGQGLTILALPQGSYTVTPTVTAVSPAGTRSETQLPSVPVTAGCRQVLDLGPELQLTLGSLPVCTGEPRIRLTGAVAGASPVDRLAASVNGGPEVVACTGCGQNPPFSFEVPLQACDNRIATRARDAAGNTAAVTAFTRFDATAPRLDGCRDLRATAPPGSTGAPVSFLVTAADGCDGSLPVTCDHPSGSVFPIADTVVTCTATDRCGNRGSCKFTVSFCPAAREVRTQAFWVRQCQGPHPSGEAARLPGYVDAVNDTGTFAAVATVGALCDRLVPQPANNRCELAEAHFLALLLNRAAGRIADSDCLKDPAATAATTVGAAVLQIDTWLRKPRRTAAQCTQAQELAERINNSTNLAACR
jgi:hypothetical protein